MKIGKLAYLLFSAILSLAMYAVLARFVFMSGWEFDLFDKASWIYVKDEWNSGWVLESTQDKLFAFALLFLVPGWIVVWVLTHIYARKLALLPIKIIEARQQKKLIEKSIKAAQIPTDPSAFLALKKTVKNPAKSQKTALPQVRELDRLRGMKSSNAGGGHTAPASASQSAPSTAPQETSGTFGDDEPDYVEMPDSLPINTEPRPLDCAKLWDDIAQTLENKKVFIFREMKIADYPTNIIVVTQEAVFILAQGPVLGNDWLLAEDNKPPVWLEGKDALASPLRPLVQARDNLKKYLQESSEYPDIVVNACLILDHGTIKNPQQLIDKLESWDISVLRMGTCTVKELPQIAALLEYIQTQPPSSQDLNDAVAVAILDLMESDFEE